MSAHLSTSSTSSASSGEAHRKPNRLVSEKSPYLLQHAYNPVDWYPWGEEAFKAAKDRNVPIFLSVGYSTCHWCHVMERESFENETIANLLNNNFVPVKVDREERPDVDRVYMTYVTARTGSGGWPMSVFLTPNLEPFFGGTYFPPSSFAKLLNQIAILWKDDKKQSQLKADSAELMTSLQSMLLKEFIGEPAELVSKGTTFAKECMMQLEEEYDEMLGGFGGAPKFPRPVIFNFLFTFYSLFKSSLSKDANHGLKMALNTLECMARGGIFDHLGGGFHRYSVDQYWHIPHFEKMLYDQAQLIMAYSDGYLLAKNSLFKDVVEKTFFYLTTCMLHPEGGFYSAEDADSLPPTAEGSATNHPEKKEGAFYIWDYHDIERNLKQHNFTDEDVTLFSSYFGVTTQGNIRPESDPHRELKGMNHFFIAKKISDGPTLEKINAMKQVLYDARSKRPRPHLDDKILTAWNALLISGLVKASEAFGDEKFYQAAVQASRFIEKYLYADKKLLRSFRGDRASDIDAFLEDYAFLIQALLDLYNYDGDFKWLSWAEELQEKQDTLFLDKEAGGYFSSSKQDSRILLRIKVEQDSAEPAGNSVACKNLARLYAFTKNKHYLQTATNILPSHANYLQRLTSAVPELVIGVLAIQHSVPQIIITYREGDDITPLLDSIRMTYSPFRSIVRLVQNETKSQNTKQLLAKHEFLKDYNSLLNEKPTIYHCKNFTCQLPSNEFKSDE